MKFLQWHFISLMCSNNLKFYYCYQESSQPTPSNPSKSFPAHADIPIWKCLYSSYLDSTASHSQQKWPWQWVHVILLQPCVFSIFALHVGQRFAFDWIHWNESYSWKAWRRRSLPYCFSRICLLSKTSFSHVSRSFKSDGINLHGDTPCHACLQSTQKQNRLHEHSTKLSHPSLSHTCHWERQQWLLQLNEWDCTYIKLRVQMYTCMCAMQLSACDVTWEIASAPVERVGNQGRWAGFSTRLR